jgi:hypothetical protein
MATFDYAGLKVDVDELLEEFGTTHRLISSTAVVSDPVNGTVVPGGTTTTDVLAVIVDYEDKLVDGTTIRRGDRQALVQAVVEPKQGDTFREPGGRVWSVEDVDAVNPAGLALLYTLQLRR